MNIFDATRSYESWLARHTAVVRKDLRLKHERLAESPFVFLRGTFYRWIQQWPAVCAKVADAPLVLSVGDLHIENFGTWRDVEGRLVWGVNDLDEACALPYTHDLVRLATSAVLAIESHDSTCPCGMPATRSWKGMPSAGSREAARSSWPSAAGGCGGSR